MTIFPYDPDPWLVRVLNLNVFDLPLPTLKNYVQVEDGHSKFYIHHEDNLKLTSLQNEYGCKLVAEATEKEKQAYLIEAFVYSLVKALDMNFSARESSGQQLFDKQKQHFVSNGFLQLHSSRFTHAAHPETSEKDWIVKNNGMTLNLVQHTKIFKWPKAVYFDGLESLFGVFEMEYGRIFKNELQLHRISELQESIDYHFASYLDVHDKAMISLFIATQHVRYALYQEYKDDFRNPEIQEEQYLMNILRIATKLMIQNWTWVGVMDGGEAFPFLENPLIYLKSKSNPNYSSYRFPITPSLLLMIHDKTDVLGGQEDSILLGIFYDHWDNMSQSWYGAFVIPYLKNLLNTGMNIYWKPTFTPFSLIREKTEFDKKLLLTQETKFLDKYAPIAVTRAPKPLSFQL